MKVSVVGLGYVGLPLAIRLTEIGFEVLAIDKDKQKIASLKIGYLPFAKEEPKLQEKLKKTSTSKKLDFSTTFSGISTSKIIFICVNTPVEKDKPNYSFLISALKSVSKYFKKGTIIIIESTVSPLTTKDLITPILEKESKMSVSKDFFVAVIPERIRPNYIFKQLTSLPRVIGISDKKIQPVLVKIYSKITSGGLDFVDTTTAEVVKTVENTYRDINIAFANEVALACEELGVNIWQVRELVNKSPFHDLHKPGSGVGGHCIPKDPILLTSSLQREMPLTLTARKINDFMPNHILELTKKALKQAKKEIKTARLAILGYTYVENSDDTRNSPTETLVKLLERDNINFSIHDPLVRIYKKDIDSVIRNSDCLILMVAHSAYKKLNLKRIAKLMRSKVIIDGRNLFKKVDALKIGFIYKAIGNV